MKELVKKLIPGLILSAYHYVLSGIGAFWYGFPSKKLIVIGVTGTSGKSTVVNLTTKIFQEAGIKVASMSSINFTIDREEFENKLKMTMPGRMKVQRFLKKAVEAGCQYVIMEVTSEGIKQHRHQFINFDTAVFTNLSPEHIESHGSFEKYREAKLKLFKKTKKRHIVNGDDKNVQYFLKIPSEKKIVFGIENYELGIKNIEKIQAEEVRSTESSSSFIIHNYSFIIPLVGKFNVYNALTAISIATSQEISLDICKKSLEKVKSVVGRMELVSQNPRVIVDYAHTPTQLEKVYQSIEGKKICVLGSCGGGRDKWKRPVLGEIAEKYCTQIIITNEDPYDEDPMKIIEEVAGNTKVEKILDRKEAIKRALNLAQNNETVIITGKGSETLMCVKGGKKIPWSDKQIVLDLLGDLG
ncbi:UDP-N-acetylmuramoyl-L-alanyl-D-glutamate--2,6-diaminopimelate ligase [Patescibacteria group bacterium]|nr:UDP-N-acetylmuramoyl-L-alanyl-D-glutamate--2,6-diaminopimelate ligase [Patescibacteria group bacterium]